MKRFKGNGYTLVDNQYIATDTKKANDSNSNSVENTNNINQYNGLPYLDMDMPLINEKYRKEITYFKQQRCNKYITETK